MNKYNSQVEQEILEGFLCPICLQDLSSITALQTHFEDQHGNEDKAILQALKGLVSKAKRKFLQDKPTADSTLLERVDVWSWESPVSAVGRSHTTLFKRLRSARIDSTVVETNKLLVRLDKLLTDLPHDPIKRKAHEKKIVQWADDKDVPLCPFCARSFFMTRRHHHCRLCGGVTCHECSMFLTFEYAQKLIGPVHQGIERPLVPSVASLPSLSVSSVLSGISALPRLKRSGSQGSLHSLLLAIDSTTGEHHFRVCAHCMTRLEARDSQVQRRTSQPTLSLYYSKLTEYCLELKHLLPQYTKMADSLQLGETVHGLQDAEELRVKILRLGDNINCMAQRIKLHGIESKDLFEGDSLPMLGPLQTLLQKRIHSSAVSFLKENVLGLSKLPSQQEMKDRRKQRQMQLIRQAEKSVEGTVKIDEKSSVRSPSKPIPASVKGTPDKGEGWSAGLVAHNVIETDDPFIQQMNILRSYIKQARETGHHSEVVALEKNLHELQDEYKKQLVIMKSDKS